MSVGTDYANSRNNMVIKRTDAHKGLPYYTTPMRATPTVYSRVAPCGRPWDSQSNCSHALSRPFGLSTLKQGRDTSVPTEMVMPCLQQLLVL